ncbi:helix-turn-helix domain-containing protein [Treponema denticola]|uniref:Uncharacterized protein n=1 Tax=Treponema denticola SP33 TaxID=999437 RepID=M2AZ25_TREDN|nr:helix-turn-helix domain-containing protein [Treponema denticola]EMB22360.1 hypothetical protein HMPREF9733_01776 [Treponema denticola SP33]EPF35362.1 hypothetical protein HMPREF9732_02687 [Treponema denticola SP32]UTD12963.1 helix-turn-helix domain-containing protein [Treponema denticola]
MGKRPSAIVLTDEETEYLETQTRIRTLQAQIVTRARILLLRAQAASIEAIADKVGLNRCSVMLCLKKFHEGAVLTTLFTLPQVAAEIPKLLMKKLISPVRNLLSLGMLLKRGHIPNWLHIFIKRRKLPDIQGFLPYHKSTVHTILSNAQIKPHKMRYYCENRDPNFDQRNWSFICFPMMRSRAYKC